MTEEEAKTKWCPFARGSQYTNGNSNNRTHEGEPGEHTRCIGSACMAWRWLPGSFEVVNTATGERLGVRDIARLPDERFERGKPTTGYCGLAGPLP